jgi:hypothetical protein
MAYGFVERTVNGQRVLFHGGDIFSYQSGLFLLPEHDLGLFVSYAGGGYGEPLTLFHALLDTFFPAPVARSAAADRRRQRSAAARSPASTTPTAAATRATRACSA